MMLTFERASRDPPDACFTGSDRLPGVAAGQTKYFYRFFELDF